MTNMVCPLCHNEESFSVVEGPDARVYRSCSRCKLIFTEPRFQPSRQREKERYMTHNNGIQYKGYVNFLNRAIKPSLFYLSKNKHGLDFGCGPEPTLSVILARQGYSCDNYDPLFFPELAKREYDFIFATESFEHFFFPSKEIQRINNLLKPNGILIIMTETWESTEAFAGWYYAKDFTHVCFFHVQTFDYIAWKYGFDILAIENERVFILRKR